MNVVPVTWASDYAGREYQSRVCDGPQSLHGPTAGLRRATRSHEATKITKATNQLRVFEPSCLRVRKAVGACSVTEAVVRILLTAAPPTSA